MTQVTQQKLESVSVAAALVLFVAAPQEQESFVAPFYNPPHFTCYFGEDICFLLFFPHYLSVSSYINPMVRDKYHKKYRRTRFTQMDKLLYFRYRNIRLQYKIWETLASSIIDKYNLKSIRNIYHLCCMYAAFEVGVNIRG